MLERVLVAIPPSSMASAIFHPSTLATLNLISMSMQIMGDDDMSMMTLGEFVNSLDTLKLEVVKLKVDVVSQGG